MSALITALAVLAILVWLWVDVLRPRWRRSRWSLAWRCCDWCDHGRCGLTPEHCHAQCVHITCHPDYHGD